MAEQVRTIGLQYAGKPVGFGQDSIVRETTFKNGVETTTSWQEHPDNVCRLPMLNQKTRVIYVPQE
ncbi:hypothetical protein ACFL2C_01330 [Patescibacteria group bacterium]